jgi:Arc/MetJ family transcription regulator
MTKRLVDVDDEALEGAQGVLGTTTMKDTVNRSLQAVVNLDRGRRQETIKKIAAVAHLMADFDRDEAWR